MLELVALIGEAVEAERHLAEYRASAWCPDAPEWAWRKAGERRVAELVRLASYREGLGFVVQAETLPNPYSDEDEFFLTCRVDYGAEPF